MYDDNGNEIGYDKRDVLEYCIISFLIGGLFMLGLVGFCSTKYSEYDLQKIKAILLEIESQKKL